MLQPSSASNIDTVFSSSHYHGVVPAESTIKLKVICSVICRIFTNWFVIVSRLARKVLTRGHNFHNVWDQSGIRIIGIMWVSICLGAILIPEYLDFHSGYSAPRSRIAGIILYSGIYSGITIFLFRNIPNERALKVPSSNHHYKQLHFLFYK